MTKEEALKTYYGYDVFRGGQEAVIDALLSGRDALAIMPTGAGKSVCYQIPALLLPGITLVVSPLVSLMRDQVTQLVQMGIPAAFLNSSLTFRQYLLALDRARAGRYKIIYVAPERLETEGFQAFVREADISLVAVDEAHCISQWGQDFRPSYLNIPAFVESLPHRPPVGAFTATATPDVKADIHRLLDLQDPLELTTGFDRENLYFEVQQPADKRAALLELVKGRPGKCGIVYCATRKNVEEVCDFLRQRGVAAARYHAGLDPEERQRNQEDFLYDRVQVMVATNAFGMGIDKSNVSYVVHYNMPGSVEAYYQEAGRAGRDGSPAECLLLWCDGDIATGRFFIEQESTHEGLTAEEAEVVRASRRRMLESMVGYCYTTGCLRAYILRYFGEGGHDEALPSQGGATEVAPYGGAGAGGANLLDGAACAPDSRDGHAACDPTLRRGGSWSALPTEENSASSSAKRCCSNCDGEFEAVDVTAEARAIMRCVQALRGRFGKTTVVDVLRGADTENLRQWGLVNLPVYGTSEARRALLMEVVELLAADGYLAITEGKFPLVGFGPRYREAAEPDFALRIKQTPKVRKGSAAKPPKAARPGAADLGAADAELFERLRALRLRLAQEAAVPPYVIFHDATLAAMAAARPVTEEELLALPGIGEKKLATYGKAFLEEIMAAPSESAEAE